MEDESGPINVIVKPDIYKRDRSTVRMEPFLAVKGRLQKDGASLNVIAYEVNALRVGYPLKAGRVSLRASTNGGEAAASGEATAGLQASLPRTMEWWADPGRAGPSPFRYLTALRQSPPGIKSWG